MGNVNQDEQVLQKSTSHVKTPGITSVICTNFHIQDPEILGTKIQNLVTQTNLCLGFVHPWTKSITHYVNTIKWWYIKECVQKWDRTCKQTASTQCFTCSFTCIQSNNVNFISTVRYVPLSDSVSLVLPTRCLLLRALDDRVSFRVITAFFEPSPSLSDSGPDSTADDGAFDCGGVSTRDRTPGRTADFLMAAVFLWVGFVVAEESADESVSELLSTKWTPCTIRIHTHTVENFLCIVSSWLYVCWWTAKTQQNVRKTKTKKCFNMIPVRGNKIMSTELI